MVVDIEKTLEEMRPKIDKAIEKFVPRKFDEKSMISALGPARYKYNIDSINKAISEPIWDYLDRGGKRWRPVLFLLVYEALGGKQEDVLDFAVLPELIHNACVTGDTFILKNPGEHAKITQIQKGELVYTLNPDGTLGKNKVIGTWYDGIRKVYKIYTRNKEIRATENHPFLVLEKEQPIRCKITESGRRKLMKVLKRGDIRRISEQIKRNIRVLHNAFNPKYPQLLEKWELKFIFNFLGLKLEKGYYVEKKTKFETPIVRLVWKPLKDLKVGDLIVALRKIKDEGKPLQLPQPSKNPAKDKTTLPTHTTTEFCQLFGYFLGDGSVTIDKKSSKLYICPSKEIDEKISYKKLFLKVFNYRLRSEIQRGYERFLCCSYKVCWLLKKLGLKKKAPYKTIPSWIFTLPEDQKLAFIRGYLDSDGYVQKNGTVVFGCASKDLITKLKLLLDSIGFATGHVLYRKIRNLWKNSKRKESDQWYFYLSNPNEVLKRIGTEKKFNRGRLTEKRKGLTFEFSRPFPNPPLDLDKFKFERIKNIKFESYEPVYDLMIQNSHNFIANNITVHNTIIHDDIEDRSEERRGKPALHLLFGEDVAINVGDIAYFLPFLSLMKNRNKFDREKILRAYEICLQELIRAGTGQATDMSWHNGMCNADNVSESEYLQMLINKTGCIARMSARLAASFAGRDEKEIELFGKFAETIGVAFQIQDDILNLTGEKFAKRKGGLGEDITEGKRSLPVVYTLQKADEKDRKRLLEILSMHTTNQELRDEAIGIIIKYDSIEQAKEKAESLVKEAWNDIEKILPESRAKEKLKAFTYYLIERKI